MVNSFKGCLQITVHKRKKEETDTERRNISAIKIVKLWVRVERKLWTLVAVIVHW